MVPEKINTFLMEAFKQIFLGQQGEFSCHHSEHMCLLYGVKRCMKDSSLVIKRFKKSLLPLHNM
jgi:hypothetical protein